MSQIRQGITFLLIDRIDLSTIDRFIRHQPLLMLCCARFEVMKKNCPYTALTRGKQLWVSFEYLRMQSSV